jgi:hypothetical protein
MPHLSTSWDACLLEPSQELPWHLSGGHDRFRGDAWLGALVAFRAR